MSAIVPPGLTRGRQFAGSGGRIGRIAWSPDGAFVAASTATRITVWDAETGVVIFDRLSQAREETIWDLAWAPNSQDLAAAIGDEIILIASHGGEYARRPGQGPRVYSVDWSPDQDLLATASADHRIRIWNRNGALIQELKAHARPVYTVAWSPDGTLLASASKDRTVGLWNTATWELRARMQGHGGPVVDVAWSPDGSMLASASMDATIRVWDVALARASVTLEGHTDSVYWVAFSPDGALLASTSSDQTIRFWDRTSWRSLTALPRPYAEYGYYWPAGVAFDPKGSRLATLDDAASDVRVWNVDIVKLRQAAVPATVQQATAKVVLLGDAGVGKSALAHVLAGGEFVPTESTHGSSFRILSSVETRTPDGSMSVQEVVLWDIATDPHGFGVEGNLAVVVADALDDPSSIRTRNWIRLARQGSASADLPIILAVARADRALPLNPSPWLQLAGELNLLGPVYVSALTGIGIASLREFIQREIRWDAIPIITSPAYVQTIKIFLQAEIASGRLVATADQLYRSFVGSRAHAAETRAQFDLAIRLIASAGLIAVLSVGDLVLLQPQILNHYASAIVRAARDEPSGLGSIPALDLQAGRFPIPEPRVRDDLEPILLSATMQELLRRELAMLEGTGDTAFLLLPAEVRRERPQGSERPRGEVILRFNGPARELYASTVVRLQYSEDFRRTSIWRNSVEYAAPGGGTCGLQLRQPEEGRGELQLSFAGVTPSSRALFVEYVQTTLEKTSARGSIERSRIVICPTCGTEIGERQVAARLGRGYQYIDCPVCDTRINLVSETEEAAPGTSAFDRSAEVGRERSEAAALLQAKVAAGDFDVYVSYNGGDKIVVREVAARLREFGILPWILEDQIGPGDLWKLAMSDQASKAKAMAIFIGNRGVGPTQADEIEMLVAEAKSRRVALIPVLLPDLTETDVVPESLREHVWVDFRQPYPDPMELLVRGIAGSRGTVGHSAAKPRQATVEEELVNAYTTATKGQDWARARELMMELAYGARADGRSSEAAAFAMNAVMIADDPEKLGGRGFREPLDLVVVTDSKILEEWLPESHHREAVLTELREIAKERREVFGILDRAGIRRWMEWFDDPDPAKLAELPRGGQGWPAARVRRLRLVNIKSFRDVTLDFTGDGLVPHPVTTFVGDNATGKSTILQCIALAYLGSSFAAKIESVSAQTLLRNGESSGAIELELDFSIDVGATPAECAPVRLGLALDSTRKDLYPLEDSQISLGPRNDLAAWNMLRSQVGLQWGYCGGYGAFRALRERRDTFAPAQTPIEIDRMLSLFQPQATLLEPAVLESILQADVSSLSRDPSHIPLGVRDSIAAIFRESVPGVEPREINGRLRLVEIDSGVSSTSALSDGYNSMLGLLGHMVRHALELRAWTKDPTQIEGVVMVDEIDLHLHPGWQRNALPQLIKAFPRIQFIVTTHSPLVLAGLPSHADVAVLSRGEGGETSVEYAPNVKGWRVDQLLTGVHFDVDAVYDTETEELRTQYGRKLAELGPAHPHVLALEEQLRKQMRAPHSSTNPDRDLSALLDEFVAWRLQKLSPEERQQTLAKMWQLLQ